MTMVANLFNRDNLGAYPLPSGRTIYRIWLEGEPAIKMMKRLLPHMFGRRANKIVEVLEKANA